MALNTLAKSSILFENPEALKSSSTSDSLALGAQALSFATIGTLAESFLGEGFELSVGDNPYPLTKWVYSQFSFGDRQIAVNSGTKQSLDIDMNLFLRPRGAFFQIAKIQGLVALINKYIAGGGSFSVITPSQVYRNCLCKEVTALETKDFPGQLLSFKFQQALLSASDFEGLFPSNQTNRLSAGGSIS